MATKPPLGGDVNLGSGDQAIDNGDEVPGQRDLPQEAGTIGGHPVFVSSPPDLPDPLIGQDGPPPIDPDGGAATTATAFGVGAKGTGDEVGDPVVTSKLAGLRVGARDEPVEIVDDGDKPGEEGSAVEGARAGVADVVSEGFGSIGLDDLASGDEGSADDVGSLLGLDRASEQELAARLPGGGKDAEVVDMSGGGSDQGSDTTAKPPREEGQLREKFDARGEPPQNYAPGDFGADPDQPPSGGNPSLEAGGKGTTTDTYTDPQGWTSVVSIDWDNPEGLYADGGLVSPDGSYVERYSHGEDTVVSDDIGGKNAIIHEDGSMTIIDTKTGQQTTEPPPPKPDAGMPAGDTAVVLTPEEQEALRDSIDALGQHRGDQGRETQPTEGDDGAFGAGAPKSEISILETRDRAIDMLGQPGSSDLDFGGGGGGGGGRLPDDGAIDPGRDADAPRQTDGAEQDPFDRQQGTLEPTDESADDGSDDGASLLQPGDLRPVDETEHLREVTLDIG